MDAITAFRAALLSPVFMAAVAILVAAGAKVSSLPKPTIASLIGRSLAYAVIGAVVSVALPVAWIWHQVSTGGSSGSFRAGSLFLYGSLGVALGQLIALVHWWFQKPPSHASGPKSQSEIG